MHLKKSNKLSKWAIWFILGVAIYIRIVSIDFSRLDKHLITNYDALGYYMYLPATLIYQDITQYEWIDEIDAKYKVAGEDWMFQIGKHESGNYVTNYLGGISFLQLPFFLGAHVYASVTDYPADGFSTPYQVALSFAPLFYFILILFLLRNILLRYYDDEVVAFSMVLLFLASNAIEYIAIEAGHCHAYILLMYTWMIWLTIRWHEKPKVSTAFLVGLVIGWTTIMRPTELIIFLIPLLWNTHTKEASHAKWKLVRDHKKHLMIAVFATALGALPQIIYWLYVTGSPINLVGSKWYFLNPYFRVLLGWQKGWFIYTPVTIFFVLGLFFIKNQPFKKSVIWFGVLNIWIVISWANWRYGGSYSTRALVQSYPVFALALGGFISWIFKTKMKVLFYVLGIYLLAVNLFQIWQYNQGILRHDEMNRAYYQSVYLDSKPTPLDMSMLDGGERVTFSSDTTYYLRNVAPKESIESGVVFFESDVREYEWLDFEMELRSTEGFWRGYIVISVLNSKGEEIDVRKFRMFNHLTKHNQMNFYRMQIELKEDAERVEMKFGGGEKISAKVRNLVVRGGS